MWEEEESLEVENERNIGFVSLFANLKRYSDVTQFRHNACGEECV